MSTTPEEKAAWVIACWKASHDILYTLTPEWDRRISTLREFFTATIKAERDRAEKAERDLAEAVEGLKPFDRSIDEDYSDDDPLYVWSESKYYRIGPNVGHIRTAAAIVQKHNK